LTRPGAPGRRGFAFRHCRGRHRAHGRQHQSHQHHQQRISGQLTLIRTLGPLLDACRTQWNRGFTALERAGSGGSWRSIWRGAPRPWGWRCRC